MKLLICILTASIAFAGGSRVVTFKELQDNYLSDNKITLDLYNNLKCGEVMKLKSSETFLLKTKNRNLIVENLVTVEEYRTLNEYLIEKKRELEYFDEYISTEELILDEGLSIKPFSPEDF